MNIIIVRILSKIAQGYIDNSDCIKFTQNRVNLIIHVSHVSNIG